MSDGRLRLRSYRVAFELERRIHRIDRFRIPVPYGLPLATVGWWAGACVAVLLMARLPLAGEALDLLPWPLRLGLLPAAVARGLCVLGPDRRPAWERAMTRARRSCGPRVIVAFASGGRRETARLEDLIVGPDERAGRLRPCSIRDGGEALVYRPAVGRRFPGRTRLSPGADRWLQEPQGLPVVR